MPHRLAVLSCTLLLGASCAVRNALPPPSYRIVASETTLARPDWKPVLAKIRERHPQARILSYRTTPQECLAQLRRDLPACTAFVARPEEASRLYVAEISRLCRAYNDDPYTDTAWGVITGFDAANALEMAACSGIELDRVVANTELVLDCIPEGRCFDELQAGLQREKTRDGRIECRPGGPRDTTALMAGAFADANLFVSSSHGSERSWQMGHTYPNGFFLSKNGELSARDSSGKVTPMESRCDKAWMPVGNCLVGHIDGPDAFMLAMLKDGRVRAAAAYTVPTWFGYAGWGHLDYFFEQPGRYTYAEAVRANRLALEHKLYSLHPEAAAMNPEPGDTARFQDRDSSGLLHDRDVMAYYGDPAARVRLVPGPCAYRQRAEARADGWLFEAEGDFSILNGNGSQRGGRPLVFFLPERIEPARFEIAEGAGLKPLVGPDFVLIPRPAAGPIRVVLKSKD
ncbi:MAG: hypothetical protein RL095_2194 [Verrucomicrobiota bacterium]